MSLIISLTSDFHDLNVIKKICRCRSNIVLHTTKMFMIQRTSVYDNSNLKKINTIQTLEQSINSHSEMFTNAEEEKKKPLVFSGVCKFKSSMKPYIINS